MSSLQTNGPVGPRRGSVWWLVAVSAAFTLAVLLFTPLRIPLAWDESVYASQISRHIPIMPWAPPRGRGMPLLVAPVTLLTGSVVALRVYLALLSGVALFLALLAWRGLRSAMELALAGVLFGGVWITQIEASQALAELWLAFSTLAAVGLFLQFVTGGNRKLLVPLAITMGLTSLVHGPTDGVFIVVPMVAGLFLVADWRRHRRPALAALAIGLTAAIGEWCVEAFMYFNDPLARLREAARGGSGFGFFLGRYFTTLVSGGDRSALTAWWIVFLMLVVLGLWADRRVGGLAWRSAALASTCGFASLAQYALFLPVPKMRYLLSLLALWAIPAAGGIAWLIRGSQEKIRVAATVAAAVFLVAGLMMQHLVLTSAVRSNQARAREVTRVVEDLRHLGVRPQCNIIAMRGLDSMPVAFYMNCRHLFFVPCTMRTVIEANSDGQQIVLTRRGRPVPPILAHWTKMRLSRTNEVAYIRPRQLLPATPDPAVTTQA
jgi:hypothetical protein